jgi:hypothetical protein
MASLGLIRVSNGMGPIVFLIITNLPNTQLRTVQGSEYKSMELIALRLPPITLAESQL